MKETRITGIMLLYIRSIIWLLEYDYSSGIKCSLY
jgi:hypothetical protein